MQLLIDLAITFGLVAAVIAATIALYDLWTGEPEDPEDEYGEPHH